MKDTLKEAQEKMEKTIGVLERDLKAVRAGRANPAVLDRIMVDYYGSATPIQQVAAISVSEARVLVIQPWDKSLLKAVEKAIQASDLGINPNNDGNVIRLAFPPLTEERRKELVKGIRKSGEDAKVALRSIRRDANEKLKSLKKDSAITEDDQKDGEKKIQETTDRFVKEVDNIIKAKEDEIMSI